MHERQTLALSAIGHTYRDFRITSYLPIPELHSTLIELVHAPTGARVMHIANDDPENLFCLSFQTLPNDSKGAAHILEHTVLCGSSKFPIKDPFFSMTRRSLNTFMNAFTGQDFTCYPASSQVKKDFYNLLEVYLDAAFHPELKHLSFLQEGHRLEWSNPKNFAEPLLRKGVVYNEMKGAMTSAEARLSQSMLRLLTPDLPYAYNSGGDPKAIPDLSYEELVEFHQTFYHPSRCIFFFYGDLPLSDHLDFLCKHALKGVGALAPLAPLPAQRRFHHPVRVVEHYPIAPGEKTTARAQIAFGWLTASIAHQSELLGLCLLEIFLMETDASPLKRALLKSKLCAEAESSIDVEMSESPVILVCKGCDPAKEEALKGVVFKTLENIAAKPLDAAQVEAALHQLEFQRTEIGGEGWPFGLTLFMRAALIKHHGSRPEDALLIHSLFAELRDRLKSPEYLPNLIRKYLLDNQHFVTLVLLPDPEMQKREETEETAQLEALRQTLTEPMREQIVAEATALLKYQEALEHQSLDCLPKVTLHDVPPKSRDFLLQHENLRGVDVFAHPCFTNQITYADFLFNLPEIEKSDLPFLSLLVRMWTDLGCGGRTYEETLHFCQAHTAGIDAHLALHVMTDNPDHLAPAFSLRGKALDRNVEPFFQLLSDFAKGPDFTDKARLSEWLLQHATEMEEEFVKNALSYAIQASLSGYSAASTIYQQWNGLPYYRFVQALVKNKGEAWMQRLSALSKQLTANGRPHLIVSCDGAQLQRILKHDAYALGQWETQSDAQPWKGAYSLDKTHSHIEQIPSPVAFSAMGARTVAYRDSGVAELMIATELLENVVLHKEIREKGGAYGSGASYSPTTGNFHFSAYRDPNLSRTIATFRGALIQIAGGKFNERELEEAKLGLIASMDTPVPPGGRAIVAYAWHRANRTLEDRQRLRDEILRATKAGVASVVSEKLCGLDYTVVSLLGEELWRKEQPLCPELSAH